MLHVCRADRRYFEYVTYHATYVEARLQRAREAVRRVTAAVEARWQRSNAGPIPPGSDAAELAASAGLPGFTVKEIELLLDLTKEIFTAVNKSVVMEPLGAGGQWYVRRELRKAVKTAERSASRILEDLGRAGR